MAWGVRGEVAWVRWSGSEGRGGLGWEGLGGLGREG